MEYEIADRPQMGENDAYKPVEAPLPQRHKPLSPRELGTEQRDRAVVIPEQESGS